MSSHTALLHIDGAWREASGGDRGRSLNPATGETIGGYADGGVADAQAGIEAARVAFEAPDWSHSPRLRQSVMLGWADRLMARAEEIAVLLSTENGKVIGQARAEVQAGASDIRFYAGLARYTPGHVLETEPGAFSTLLREPAGVAALVIPWNAPIKLLTRALSPALAAGCTVVIKAAPQAAQTIGAVIRELTSVPGLPPGVVNLLTESGSDISRTLVESDQVDVLSFTGSSATGAAIVAASARTMKKLSLELGGKASCLVFEDAEIDPVARAIAAAATIISGQQCTAARRVLVHRSRLEEMKAALRGALQAIVVGPGLEPRSQMGPLIDESALRRYRSRVNDALEACDEVVLEGGRVDGPGFFVAPTLVAHADSAAFFCQEEIFGPFVVLEAFDDEREAVARANHSEFGLAASVWTRDGARAMRVARALRNGTVWINDHNKLFTEAETGGYRRSGMGRLHGAEAMNEFMETKHICQSVGVL